MAIAHILTDADSLQSLAQQYLGDTTRWGDIAEYNKLEYPYTLKDKANVGQFYAAGYLTVVRADYSNPVVLRKGWTFQTKPSIFVGGVVKTYEVVQDTTIPAGVATYYVPIVASTPGTFGNVMEYMITEAGSIITQNGVSFISIYNEQKITGGRDVSVKFTGDTIYIPTLSSEVVPEDVNKMIELIGGQDIVLAEDGDIALQEGGDLAAVSGRENIAQAVAMRCRTALGDLILHPEYGTDIEELVGMPNLANRDKLAQIAILRALAQEDRITNVTINSVVMQLDKVYIDIGYTIAVTNQSTSIQLTM